MPTSAARYTYDTSIPVPNVIAYDSSSENPLGFEWMLHEKTGGVPLSDVWEEMDFDSKVRLTLEISNLLQQQHDLELSKIGKVYFAVVATQVNNRIETSSNADTFGGRGANGGTLKVDRGIGADFVIDRIVSPWFFRDKPVLLPADRGPFSSLHDLMMANAQIRIERVSNLSPSPSYEIYSETDEELAKDQHEVLKTCQNLKALIPKIFPSPPNGRKEINVLYHLDLSNRNIIVHPTSYRINGIVNWESVGVRPVWQACEYPHFLKGNNTGEPPPVGASGVDEEALVEIRKDWEKVFERGSYLQSLRVAGKYLNGIPLVFKAESDLEMKRKWIIENLLHGIENRWTAAKHWIPKLSSMDLDALDTFLI